MGDLLVNDVPDALRRSLEKRAGEAGHSISDEVKAILEREVVTTPSMTTRSGLDTLRSIMLNVDADEAEAFSQIMNEIEAERKKDFGRPFEDYE